jgi:hypothetical protein
MTRTKRASGFLGAWIDAAPPLPEEPLSPDAARFVDEQLDIARSALNEIAKDIRAAMDRDLKMQAGRKSGGKKTGRTSKARAGTWHVDCADKARAMLRQGRSPHELAGILAPRFCVTARQLRTVLQSEGVLSVRKTLKKEGK